MLNHSSCRVTCRLMATALSQCLRLMPASYQLRIGAVMKSSRCIHAAAQFVCQHWYPAKGGCLVQFVLVDFIDAFLGPLSPQKAFTGACRAGTLESTLEYLLSCATPIWKEALYATAQGGHLHVLRWMGSSDRRGPWRSDFDNLLGVAASHGHLKLVKWLFERGLDLNTTRKLSKSTRGYYAKAWSCRHDLCEGLQLAAGNGHLAVVQWLHSVRREVFAGGPMESIMDYAVAGGISRWHNGCLRMAIFVQRMLRTLPQRRDTWKSCNDYTRSVSAIVRLVRSITQLRRDIFLCSSGCKIRLLGVQIS